MAPVITSVKQLVNENAPTEFMTASEVLIKLADNVLQNPAEQKYRRLRLGNPAVEKKLLPVCGAMECLFEMGFTEDGDFLTLPSSAPLSVLSQIKTQLENERGVLQRATVSTHSASASAGSATSGTVHPAGAGSALGGAGAVGAGNLGAVRSRNQSSRADVVSGQHGSDMMHTWLKEQEFYKKLQSQIQHVLVYEDRRLQQKAREVIPVSSLEKEAKEKLEMLNNVEGAENGNPDSVPKLDTRDCLVVALLNWFKNSFFRWVDAPSCRVCGGKTTGHGSIAPTQEEMRFGGNRVENYKCNSCQAFTKFVRYNDPGKLLETREGRCGEWANCFTLCCRALGFEARYVLDWTDHVWTEVFSDSQQRWIHCDPCENTFDKPLLYESGWGKKLTYVIAFSVDDVEDVTWRYSANFEETCRRRLECREDWLVKTLYSLDKQKWESMPEAKKNVRLKRKVAELVEFLTPNKGDGQNLSGRTTGSVAWRLARGEMGNKPAAPKQPFLFKLTDTEKCSKTFKLSYSCANDEYSRPSNNSERTTGFGACVNGMENVFRKVEHDWKMVYVARTEGSDKAEISWKFDFEESGLKIDQAEIKIDCATYENGRIMWTVCAGAECFMLRGGPTVQKVSELEGEAGFTLTATLTGGRGDVAWQHTQLFRQSSEDTTTTPFEIHIQLK